MKHCPGTKDSPCGVPVKAGRYCVGCAEIVKEWARTPHTFTQTPQSPTATVTIAPPRELPSLRSPRISQLFRSFVQLNPGWISADWLAAWTRARAELWIDDLEPPNEEENPPPGPKFDPRANKHPLLKAMRKPDNSTNKATRVRPPMYEYINRPWVNRRGYKVHSLIPTNAH